jgi:hypothetical protein
MQRLFRLPTTPNLDILRRRKPTCFPWVIDTTFAERIYIGWCCIDLLRPQRLPENSFTRVMYGNSALRS